MPEKRPEGNMKIVLIQTGKTTDSNIAAGVEDYSKRISRYTSFDIITVPDLKNTKNMPAEEQKQKEAEKVIPNIMNDDFLIILDEKGKEFTTREFSAQLEKLFMMSRKRIVFLIGGPYGFSDSIYKRADMKLSLSKMTFSHQVVRLLFTEQLYRAFSVIKGDPYHHD